MTVLEYRSTSPPEGDLARPQGHWLLWAIYLAMSWTWCIGMFLPVLLVNQFGTLGWVAFAVPNVIGAAAMGWMLRTRSTSEDLEGAHRVAMICFSGVTVAFQFFFAIWMFGRIEWLVFGTVVLAATLIPIGPRGRSNSFELAVAVAVLLISAACVMAIVTQTVTPVTWSVRQTSNLAGLTPVMIFGFALCPYLDLTFHHARRQTNYNGARFSFGIGFGLLFLAMISFTLLYRYGVPLSLSFNHWPKLAWWSLAIYLMVQLAFTMGVHVRQVVVGESFGVGCVLLLISACLGGLSYWGGGFLEELRPGGFFRSGPETMYRLYMGFYGLVFPAYVWLCMIPSPWKPPSRRVMLVFAIAVVIAAPFFWMGFIEGRMVWLLPGLAVVLAARVLLPRRETSGKI